MFTVAYDHRQHPPRLAEPPSAPQPGPKKPPAAPIADLMLEDLARERQGDRRLLRWAAVAAVLFHIALLAITFPEITARPAEYDRPKRIHFVPQTRFKPPPPPEGHQQPPKPKAKRVPIPDPTPDDPEPLVTPEIEIPEIELSDLSDVVFGIPDAPSPGRGSGTGSGPFHPGGGVSSPKRIYDPLPPYTEEARMARIQGTAILSCVIDREGNVTDVKVLKGLTLGLTESAIKTVKTWKFEPAMRGGEPVAVYFNLVINFHLQ